MRKRFLALAILICILLSCTFPANAVSGAVLNNEYNISVGSNDLTVLNGDASVVNLYSFTPHEVGAYRVTVSEGATLSFWGCSKFYYLDYTETSSYIAYDKENNTYDIFVQKGFVGNHYLIGVVGAESFTLNVEFIGSEALPLDIGTLPWEIYEPTVELSPYTFDAADEYSSLTYVDIVKPHTAVLGADGYYHLDKEDGAILFVNVTNSAPHLPLYSAVSYGAIRDYIYDDEGNFVKKVDFNDCITQYNDNSDKKLKVYPLTYDLIYILQTHGKNKGWYDVSNEQGGYIFGTTKVHEESAWMYCVGYFPGYKPTVEEEYTVSVNGVLTQYKAGETVKISTEKLWYDEELSVAKLFDGWEISGLEGISFTGTEIEFVMPENNVELTAKYALHGDVDKDGSVTAMDVFALRMEIRNGLIGTLADINMDGKVTASDVLAILSVIKGDYNYGI